MIRLTTNFGTIDIELDYKNAPVTASNFEQYVKDSHYNGLIFHRVIPGFMIQGGGFKPGMDEVDTREPNKNEANNGLSNEKYTIAMA
ncbi:MAG: peptidylprolyl isomerase, partial [Parasutterella excrementihominis]